MIEGCDGTTLSIFSVCQASLAELFFELLLNTGATSTQTLEDWLEGFGCTESPTAFGTPQICQCLARFSESAFSVSPQTPLLINQAGLPDADLFFKALGYLKNTGFPKLWDILKSQFKASLVQSQDACKNISTFLPESANWQQICLLGVASNELWAAIPPIAEALSLSADLSELKKDFVVSECMRKGSTFMQRWESLDLHCPANKQAEGLVRLLKDADATFDSISEMLKIEGVPADMIALAKKWCTDVMIKLLFEGLELMMPKVTEAHDAIPPQYDNLFEPAQRNVQQVKMTFFNKKVHSTISSYTDDFANVAKMLGGSVQKWQPLCTLGQDRLLKVRDLEQKAGAIKTYCGLANFLNLMFGG